MLLGLQVHYQSNQVRAWLRCLQWQGMLLERKHRGVLRDGGGEQVSGMRLGYKVQDMLFGNKEQGLLRG